MEKSMYVKTAVLIACFASLAACASGPRLVNLTGRGFEPTNANTRASSANSSMGPARAAFRTGGFWRVSSAGDGQPVLDAAPDARAAVAIAVDLGSVKTIGRVDFVIAETSDFLQALVEKYDIVYSSSPSSYASMRGRGGPWTYDWEAAGWTSAFSRPGNELGTGRGKLHIADNVSAEYTAINSARERVNRTGVSQVIDFTQGDLRPFEARYVMIYITTLPLVTAGTINPGITEENFRRPLGAANISIFGQLGPVISQAYSPFYFTASADGKSAPSDIATDITLNGFSFVRATFEGADLSHDAYELTDLRWRGRQRLTFKKEYLMTLPRFPGARHTFSLEFQGEGSSSLSFTVLMPFFTDELTAMPGHSHALFIPEYAGMSRTLGRPALIDVSASSGKFPKYTIINPKPNTAVSGVLFAPDGTTAHSISPAELTHGQVMTIPDSTPLVLGTYKLQLTLEREGETLYDQFYFTAVSAADFTRYRSIENTVNSFNSNVANINPDRSPVTRNRYPDDYPAVYLANGNLVYVPDYKGNTIIDYSNAGYQGGGAAIPNVPVIVRLRPLNPDTEDAWELIQNAIDRVSAFPPSDPGDPHSFRGAVYLEEGVYRISRPLRISSSGVVLRGAGEGEKRPPPVNEGGVFVSEEADYTFERGVTKLIATWLMTYDDYSPPTNHSASSGAFYSYGLESTLIVVSGGPVQASTTRTTVTDQYAAAGSRTVHVADTADFSAGDIARINKIVNAQWAQVLNMNFVDGANSWTRQENGREVLMPAWANPSAFSAERTIASVDAANKTITFVEPLTDNLDRRWGISAITRLSEGGRIRNVGIEGIQGIADFDKSMKPSATRYGVRFTSWSDENHAINFVYMQNVRDAWLRNFTTWHLGTGFNADSNARNITVQDGSVLDPVSAMSAGGRRYPFNFGRCTLSLVQRAYSRYARHAFAYGGARQWGPNVFLDCDSELVTNVSEPHLLWVSGILYDNTSGRIHIQNRWSYGTAQGWVTGNALMYNTTGVFIVSQPQLGPVYLIGHRYDSSDPHIISRFGNLLAASGNPSRENAAIGRVNFDHTASANMQAIGLNGGQVPNFPAYEYSVNGHVGPNSPVPMPVSIYKQQIFDRLGATALAGITKDTLDPIIDRSAVVRPKLANMYINGNALQSFDPNVTQYTIDTFESGEPVITVDRPPGVTLHSITNHGRRSSVVITDGREYEVYSISYDLVQRSPIIWTNFEQVVDEGANYAINVLNPLPASFDNYDTVDFQSRFASNASPAILQMYIGDAKIVSGLRLGLIHASPPRSYRLRFEISMDGRNWTAIPSGTVSGNTTTEPEEWVIDENRRLSALAAGGRDGVTDILQTFTFNAPVQARFIRVLGFGSDTNIWNNYWALSPIFADGTVYTPPGGLSITGASSLAAGQSVQFSAVVTPAAATVKDVMWASSNPNVATVDSSGRVSAVRAGTVVITATTFDGEYREESRYSGEIYPFSASQNITVR